MDRAFWTRFFLVASRRVNWTFYDASPVVQHVAQKVAACNSTERERESVLFQARTLFYRE